MVELAALVAIHAPPFIRGAASPPAAMLEQYWTASRCRLDRWTRLLRRLSDAIAQLPRPATLAWPRVRPVLEEILASELLTRLWTAATVAYDNSRDEEELGAVTRSIYTGHLEVRRRLLALLADSQTFEEVQAATLNQLRRRVERWTDMLLAHLARDVDVSSFAFEPDRTAEFASDLDHEAVNAQPHFTCQLMLSSLRVAFATSEPRQSPNNDLNRRIGRAILGCLGELPAGTIGVTSPLWLDRLTATADDAQHLIDDLLASEACEGEAREGEAPAEPCPS